MKSYINDEEIICPRCNTKNVSELTYESVQNDYECNECQLEFPDKAIKEVR